MQSDVNHRSGVTMPEGARKAALLKLAETEAVTSREAKPPASSDETG